MYAGGAFYVALVSLCVILQSRHGGVWWAEPHYLGQALLPRRTHTLLFFEVTQNKFQFFLSAASFPRIGGRSWGIGVELPKKG